MKFIVLDTGSIAPAYFSRHAVQHLQQQGHTVEVLNKFDAQKCAQADLVWAEWCNEIAFEAASSGVCRRLVLRMRGYDVWMPLDTLAWVNVDALLYESRTLQDLAEERFPALKGRGRILPGGVDLTAFAWHDRKPGKTVALVSRVISDKGYQLALEWARQNPQYMLHATMLGVESNPRLVRYLQHAAPANVKLYEGVDTAKWLNEIDANYLLLPSIWETLSYTVAEAMAMGIKPLIHDYPGAKRNWPEDLVWQSFEDLNTCLDSDEHDGKYDSRALRAFVEEGLDAAKLSVEFAQLVQGLTQTAQAPVHIVPVVYDPWGDALQSGDFVKLEAAFTQVAPLVDVTICSAMAMQVASLFYENGMMPRAQMWAWRALCNGPRSDVFCLLGEIEIEGDIAAAQKWYRMATLLPATRSRFVMAKLESEKHERYAELKGGGEDWRATAKAPPCYIFVVPVRNGEEWITKCLQSIVTQQRTGWDSAVKVVVVDDASTDQTWEKIQNFVAEYPDATEFQTIRNADRKGALCNTVEAIRISGSDPEDVILAVDGDDWLAHVHVLQRVQQEYLKGAWLTYGSWMDTNGTLSGMGAYRSSVVASNTFRDVSWAATHLRTFKRHLFDKIEEADLKDAAGQWFMIGGDVAQMIPMLEMAGERATYISDVLLTYNVTTTENDHKKDPQGQMSIWNVMAQRAKYTVTSGIK